MATGDAPTVIDLFAGCGGFTQGFVDAGFEPVLAVEIDPEAASTYAANFDPDATHTVCGDIAEIPASMIPEADVVVGGPPCQGFSGLGLQDPDDPRNKLWSEYLRIVEAAHPKVFVIENVDRFARSPEFELLLKAVESGPLSGFRLTTAVLDAADYGVPQRRRRTIVIGSRIGEPGLPVPTHGNGQLGREQWRTVHDAIGSLQLEPLDPTLLGKHTCDLVGAPVRGPYKGCEIHIGRNPTELSLARYAEIPPGGGRFDLMEARPDLLPPCWRNKRTGTTDVMGRLEWDKPSVTIRTEFFKPEKGRYLHPEWSRNSPGFEDRAITHLEAATLQSFPEEFLWCGTKTSIARQIGNAVPPLLAQKIGTAARGCLAY